LLSESRDMSKENEELKFKYFKPIGRLSLIFFLGFTLYLFMSTMILIFLTESSRDVKIPDLVGKRFVEVSNSLMRKGIQADLKFEEVYDLDDGVILSQHPESGEVVGEGSTVRLVVSRSKFFIDVPNLTGAQLPIAINKLKNLHYQDKTVSISTGVISYVPSDKTAENVVISQSPRSGEKISPDTKINLLVSSGTEKKDDKRMPQVTGQSIDLCYDLLLAKGLKVKEDIVKTGDKNKSGLVFSQSIRANAKIAEGATVNLKVYWYPMKEHPYSSYEVVDFVIPKGTGNGHFEALVEDNSSKRTRFSADLSEGSRIRFIFNRAGNAKINISKDKKSIRVMSINANDFE